MTARIKGKEQMVKWILLLVSSTASHAFVAAPPVSIRGSSRPTSLVVGSSNTATSFMDELKSLGFTDGLCDKLIEDTAFTAQRYWILDNSGSMATPDGQRFVQTSNDEGQLSPCTRWKELQETAIYHAHLAGYLHVPTEFQFLNSPGPFQKSFVVKNPNDALKAQQTIQRAQPRGATPLTAAVKDVKKKIEGMLPTLNKDGTQASLVIATDGLPTDNQGYGGEAANVALGEALGSLGGLPVSTVIRLCTDEENVVEFYNSLDDRLELSLDVLDDFVSEATEVHSKNKWLTYGMPLHRFREGGFHSRLLDLLDERKLTKDELRDYVGLLFGESYTFDGLPDPVADLGGFQREVGRLQDKEDLVYDPLSKKMTKWIELNPLGGLFY